MEVQTPLYDNWLPRPVPGKPAWRGKDYYNKVREERSGYFFLRQKTHTSFSSKFIIYNMSNIR